MAVAETIKNDKTLVSRLTSDGRHECLICPHNCKLRNGQRGVCQARIANDGVVLEAYGKITHMAFEPIEKKPIYHYRPNMKILSLGGYGCSMRCGWCQNWMVSQVNLIDKAKDMSVSDICLLAKSKNCNGICFTYNEPIVYYEYIMDLSKECKSNNLDLILKTNAYAEFNIWKDICEVTSAMNIDWKGNSEQYSSFGIPNSNPIKDCIKYAIDKTHVEISVPVYHNSKLSEHEEFNQFIKQFPNVPIHLLKIYPAYKENNSQVTSSALLKKVKNIYSSSKYVYIQNVYDEEGIQDTVCSSCGDILVQRKSLTSIVYKDKCCNCTIINHGYSKF